ncbi:MAG TPA: LysM peptidoglycan-binding domain-containing protein [Bacteroidia bacterium]|nr:LysM peptidoglycan-binding domain-containing protein [Bacteroidia bacterium]
MNKINATASAFLLMALLLAAGKPVCAQPTPVSDDFKTEIVPGLVEHDDDIRAGLLYDAVTKKIVWEKDMYYAYPIASLTKMMVALITLEAIRDSAADWSDEVVVDRLYKRSRRSSSVYKTTETYTLESLLQLAMIPSNNLACGDIAKYLGGSVDEFVKKMNARAAALGMKNTFYSNPSGLPASVKDLDNSSSPHDLLLLSLELLHYDELLQITSTGYAEVKNDKRSGVYKNHNHLVIDYENDVDGLKTGYTKRARFCLTATAKKDDYRIIAIVLGVPNPYQRNEIVAGMFNKYYQQIGCGPMLSSTSGPVADPGLVTEALTASDDSSIVYRTVWTKKRKTHTVRSGESLSSIGSKYKVTYQQIKKWNHLRSNRILSGQKLLVYVDTPVKVAVKNTPASDNEDETVQDSDPGSVETVGADAALADSDDVSTTTTAKPSTKPETTKKVAAAKKPSATSASAVSAKKAAPVPAQKYVYHIVQSGDTLWSIGQRYETSVDEIKRTNNIQNARSLKPGTRLKIKIGG